MPLADLLKNKNVIRDELKGADRESALDYVARRVRVLSLSPIFGDPRKDGDITAVSTPGAAAALADELPQVKAAHDAIAARVMSDPAHLSLDPKVLRKRAANPPDSKRTPLQNRQALVRSIVYQAVAADTTLAEPGNLGRLHLLCDRRLRIVERMIYDVGAGPGGRGWKLAQIQANPGGSWPDGYERIFEYPRVPRSTFQQVCRPGRSGQCSAPLQEWRTGSVHLKGPLRANPDAAPVWPRVPVPDDVTDRLEYRGAGADAPAAVQKLFKPSPGYMHRNLMFCDHTIHALHLEALVFALSKHGKGSLLPSLVNALGEGWLRIHVPFGAERFLVSEDEPALFEHTRVRVSDLQVGDHLIIYNHPAYEQATVDGVWRLENALVVQTFPKLLMQGHGSRLQGQGGMWKDMIGLFNKELVQRRADVFRLPRTTLLGREAIKGSGFFLVRRVPASASEYDAANQRADWHLAWFADMTKEAIRRFPQRAAFVKKHQLVEFTLEKDGQLERLVGWFPLWRPSPVGQPKRRNGKIVRTEPVEVGPRNIAGWMPFFDPDPAVRDRVKVIRPRVI